MNKGKRRKERGKKWGKGVMAEGSNASVLKTEMERSIVGSNPTHA